MNRVVAVVLHCAVMTCLLYVSIVNASEDDLLSEDGFSFDSNSLKTQQPSWLDNAKISLDHTHDQVPGDSRLERSSVRVEYESAVAEGWYMRMDYRYRYFWQRDDLAERYGDRYGHSNWQRAWLQYSRGRCATKLGRQTFIWGEVEGTFVTDVVTPFDYTEQLLTDYSNVRLAQDMLAAECFFARSQLQLFYTPKAKTNLYQHHKLQYQLAPGLPTIDLDEEAEEEWGLRYKWLAEGFDISIMAARLYDNDPTVVINDQQNAEVELAHFYMYGIGTSIAAGRLLIKAEAAYKENQLLPLTADTSDRFDAALGIEYTTTDNHFFNAGIWSTHFSNESVATQDLQVLTFGWNKTYFNDNLAMSVLANWASSPRFSSATILAEYQWTDFWSISMAIGAADISEEAENITILPPEKSATAIIRYEF